MPSRSPTPSASRPSASHSPPPLPPTVTPTVQSLSLQSILASPPPLPPSDWPPHENGAQSQSKRKHDSADGDDSQAKIRRIVRDYNTHDSRIMPMTTVVCLHAAVAQKSYGTEKRFLCPPPVVHIEGPLWQMRRQDLSMTVVSETGERSFEQKAPLDNNLTSSFKFLHVTSTAKAKSFQLSLDISDPKPAGDEQRRVWATFDSAPVTIISKPSKKTAKTRNISSCILAGGPVSLFNRINSQTVRTKYMTIDHTQLCASNVTWSAFNVNVVPQPGSTAPIGGPQPVTYGCSIVLCDTMSGITTSPLIIRKVDKGRVSPDDGGPVSQMQKIALQRINADGSRHYLSAAGPLPGAGGVVAPPAPGSSAQAGTHPLLFQSPRVREEVKDGSRVVVDDVDDYLCWTIVGISKFQYTFFDAFGQHSNVPDMPITPFPTLFTAPLYRQSNNSLELTVANFFFLDPNTNAHAPLDVYLGNLGPLRHRIYQASPTGPLTNVGSYDPSDPASPSSPTMIGPPRVGPVHAIVIVEMPALADIIKTIGEDLDDSVASSSSPSVQNGTVPASAVNGRTLPLLFIRPVDGVGYHSGRSIAIENMLYQNNLEGPSSSGHNGDTGWMSVVAADAALTGWTLRVM
ncbi:Pyruvate kinase [Mycena kentingensis (nom. inval.)]|nr:Pyruvate kinase [Mycena kentingensis (nom. inval.)]